MKKTFRIILFLALATLIFSTSLLAQEPYIIVLGTAQDGGYPHLGCEKECCNLAWDNPDLKRYCVSLALVDPQANSWYLFEASPDMSDQIQYFKELTDGQFKYLPEAIFVSHAHIGHYTGLMELGKEAMNTKSLPVYTLAKMGYFLSNNGPWDQLVNIKNIEIKLINPGETLKLSENLSINTFEVPHRYEYSETAAYRIITTGKSYLFIPDIDKWERWDKSIIDEVEKVDIAFLDGTFYSADELPGRTMAEIPHPFIFETMELFSDKPEETRNKIAFIHLNHSNPAIYKADVQKEIRKTGYKLAEQGKKY